MSEYIVNVQATSVLVFVASYISITVMQGVNEPNDTVKIIFLTVFVISGIIAFFISIYRIWN